MKHTPTRINNYPRSSVEDCTPHRVPPGSSSHCRLQWHKSVSCACTSAMHSRNEVSASSFRNQTAYPTKRRSAWSSDQSDCSLRRHRQLLHSDDLGRRTTCTMCCPCGARCSLLLILFVFICTMAGDALHDTRALLSRLVSSHAPILCDASNATRLAPGMAPVLLADAGILVTHTHKSTPIIALPRRVPHPLNCRPSVLEVILRCPQEPPPPKPRYIRIMSRGFLVRRLGSKL
jgi:hypothetical protein